LKTYPPPDANYFVTNAWISATTPSLLVDRRVAFAGNLPVLEPIMPELRW